MSQPRRSTRKKRQTQLSFTPLASSSPAASQYPEQIQQRAASVRYEDKTSNPTKRRRIIPSTPSRTPFTQTSSNDGSSLGRVKMQVVIPSPSKSANQLPTPVASSQVRLDEEPASESEEEHPLLSSLSKQNSVRKSLQPIAGTNTVTRDAGRSSRGYASEEDDDDLPVRSTRRLRPALVTLSSSDDPQQSQTPEKPVTPIRRSRLFHGHAQASSPPVETDSEAPSSRLRQKTSISPNSERATDSGPKAKAGLSEARRAKNRGKPTLISDGSENSSSEDVVATPVRKRNSVMRTQPLTQETDPDEEEGSSDDLQGELEDLQETGTPLRNTRTREVPIASERSKRQHKLEELKRRRAGIREESQEDEQDEQYENDESASSELEPIHHAMRRGNNLDEYEDDFVDDEDDTMGVDLGVAGVPIELTYHANKRPFEHFKAEIEWMVHNKLNPAFDRYDEIYQLAHRKLDKEVEGFVGSKFSSSVWGEEFTKALQALPDLDRVDVPTMLEHKCDACRRSGHPPKHKVTFSGKPYNRATLEIIENNEDEDEETEDSDGDKSSSTQEGKTFFLGRFCCANAEMAHALHHWRYSLNQTVLFWLATEGYLTPAKIVERDNLRQKKRQKATNKIVDGMEETGVMKMLYKQFKENLAAARDAKPERWSNGH